MSITDATAVEVRRRANHRCEECQKMLVFWSMFEETRGELHHIYFRSQYKYNDRDRSRNLALLCVTHHRDNQYGVHWCNKDLDRRLKAEADERKAPGERSKVKAILPKQKMPQAPKPTEEQKARNKEFAKKRHNEQIARYKSQNNWLTPSQVAYRRDKEYKKAYLLRKQNNVS